MSDPVQLIGLDFGTTTSSAVIATARLQRNAVTGRCELDEVHESHRSAKVFTPYAGDLLDEERLEGLLNSWLAAGQVCLPQVFGGGALLTGLAARAANADALVELIRRCLGGALVARADDPCLEAWLAFMGSCGPLSRAYPQALFLNLDIGGGTTNLALGRAGEVLRTGCLFVGARHFQVTPGSYRLARLSAQARAILDSRRIRCDIGDVLSPHQIDAVIDFQVELLDAAMHGRALPEAFAGVPFRGPGDAAEPVITLSGGVGELVYDAVQGRGCPKTTAFGDLGIDLARRLVDAPWLRPHLDRFAPADGGRATVYGLLRHSTEVSGSTVFVSDPALLPLSDVPILGSIRAETTDADLRDLLMLACRRRAGACLHVALPAQGAAALLALGPRLAALLRDTGFPAERPLVLLVRDNIGKALGNSITSWGTQPRALVVIDEIAARDAQYVHIGKVREQVIPVSYYGLRP